MLAGHAGDVATARGSLDDPDPGVRGAALAALARAGALGADELAAAVGDPAPAVRRRAAEVAAAHPAIPATLLRLLADDDASVAEVAAWACGERLPAEPGAVETLVGVVVGHADALVREAAVAALGAIGDPAGLPAVLAALADKATVRRRAVLALAPFEGPDVEDALRRSTNDRDAQVRQAAEDLLGC